MKKLVALFATLAICVSSVYAKDKDYSVNVESKKLEVGKSSVVVDIRSKSVPVRDAVVKLRIFHPNKNIVEYESSKVNKNNEYTFSIDTPNNGEYKYLIRFNRLGGVSHIRKGVLEL